MGCQNSSHALSFYDDQLHYGIQWCRLRAWQYAQPLFEKIYKYSSFGLYAIFMGFFCGFPMGAKVVSELYGNDKISKSEANTLLAFCNNIGPAYFVGIIIPILHECGYQNTLPFVFGMYGIPAVYGIVMGFLHTDHHASNEIKPQSAQPHSSLAATLKNHVWTTHKP